MHTVIHRHRIKVGCMLLVLAMFGSITAMAANVRESKIVFLSVSACESCAKVRKKLDALPEIMLVTDENGHSVESRILMEEININNEIAAAQQLFDSFNISEDHRVAPAVFLTSTALLGSDQIFQHLNQALEDGDALVKEQPVEGSKLLEWEEDSMLTVGRTILAGIVGGLNPCALSMLLVLLSALLAAGHRAGRYAVLFLGTKAVCYLLIGTVLYTAFTSITGEWFMLTIRVLTSVISVILIVLNIMDAVNAAREHYGFIRNQLPVKTRSRLRKTIQNAVQGHHGRLGIAVVVAGGVVAAGEFLCAGQVYLAMLISQVQSGSNQLRMLLLLMIYCVGFLLPSMVVSTVVIKTGNAFETSDTLRRMMPIIKVVTAAALTFLMLRMWIG